jgi:hypothetical protein
MKKIISEISQEERNRILEMHKKATINQHLVSEGNETVTLTPGLIGVVTVGTYEGRTYNVKKVTPLNCDMVEVEFGPKTSYGYYNPSEDVNSERRVIEFKRFGEGVKSNNPCEESEDFESLGSIQFGTKPGEKPDIYQ